ncbi:hypothetical protein [Mesorhizobium sp. KR9-304]|uniref:hypothetical protein n=1 Tax=Mesorhizobium sp. KR9-304 TaxID=3156614 RepID=UPI0032B5C059
MTYRKSGGIFPGIGVAAAALALFATACSTTTVDDVAMAEGRSGGPTDTGTFPNLNIPPQAATAQFTEDEKQAKLAQLHAVQQRQNPGATAVESPEAKRKRLQLLQDEQDETLKVIEGQ